MEQNFNLYMKQSNCSVAFDLQTEKKNQQKYKNYNYFNNVNSYKDKDTFFLLDGPPYANGACHMGHLLNKVWKDFVVKNNWLLGNKVLFNPGWDCHGLPLENLVEKKYKNQNLSLQEKKVECKKLALKSVALQKKDFHSLSVTGNWENPYLTMSQDMKKYTWKTLSSLYEKDLLVFKNYPVHHCPACASSLAEAELEYVEDDKDSLYFLYQSSVKNLFFVVWTTTPWTLNSNCALAYNKNLTYLLYEDEQNNKYVVEEKFSNDLNDFLENKKLVNSNFSFEELSGLSTYNKQSTKLLHADFVTEGKTGFVHLAPAHGQEDYNLCQENLVDGLFLLDKNGKFLDNNLVHKSLVGKKNTNVTNDVLDYLKQEGLFVKHKYNKENVAVCWRHKTKVYYNASEQVFLNLEKLKPVAKKLLENSDFNEYDKQRLETMLLSRPSWCLSRQRYWGTPMNLVIDKDTNKLSDKTPYVLDLFFNNKLQEVDDFFKLNTNLKLYTDVVDVWFDSGNVAFSVQQNLSYNKAPDLVLEGKDQFRGWFQSLFWLSLAHYDENKENNLTYKNVLSHGFVLDQHKNKFSKSSKNGLTAKEAVNKYGSDTTRVWASLSDKDSDVVFSEQAMKLAQTYYKRFRLTLRFLSTSLNEMSYKDNNLLFDNFKTDENFDFFMYVLNYTQKQQDLFLNHMKNYNFKEAVTLLYEFSNNYLSAFVFEVLKPIVYLKNENDKQKQMAQVFSFKLMEKLSLMFGVFCPSMTQEFWDESNCLKSKNDDFLKSQYSYDVFVFKYDWDKVKKLKSNLLLMLDGLSKDDASTIGQTCLELNEQIFNEYSHYFKLLDYKFLLGVSLLNLNNNQKNLNLVGLKNNNGKYLTYKCPRCWYYKDKLFDNLCYDCKND